MKKYKTVCNEFAYRGRKFTIVAIDGKFGAVEDKYIDENGLTTRDLNGIQMLLSDTVPECMERIKQRVDIDALIADGWTAYKASCHVLNVPYSEDAEKALAAICAQ